MHEDFLVLLSLSVLAAWYSIGLLGRMIWKLRHKGEDMPRWLYISYGPLTSTALLLVALRDNREGGE